MKLWERFRPLQMVWQMVNSFCSDGPSVMGESDTFFLSPNRPQNMLEKPYKTDKQNLQRVWGEAALWLC